VANPQKENGYTSIANEIMDALISYRLPGEQRQILDSIFRKTYGFNKKIDAISLSQFVEMTGLKKPAVIRAIKGLLSKKIISVIKKDNVPAHVYGFNKNYEQWKPLSKKITLSKKIISVIKKDNPSLSFLSTTKDNTTKDTITKEKEKLIFPVWLDKKIWSEYKKHRQRLKAPMTIYAEKLAIDKLTKLISDGSGPDEIIKQSIDSGWKGLFPVKNNAQNNNNINIQPRTYAQAQDAERRERNKWLLKEMQNEKANSQDNNTGTHKAIGELPES
jgi:phage replication O-like protein O